MGRVIKFRAWNYIDNAMCDNGVTLHRLSALLSIKNYHVMQFTGLTDKNGVEIYEGDIVECILTDINNVHNLYVGKVFYQDYEYCVETTDNYWPVASWDCVEYCIVIGNIHQNPELLK